MSLVRGQVKMTFTLDPISKIKLNLIYFCP